MNRLILAALTLAVSCTPGEGPTGSGPRLRLWANPSEVIAAELSLAQLAQSKGQWTALRETAAPQAEMFAPQRVRAADWLKGRADPAVPAKWQPLAVWSSCDGSYAVTRGVWQEGPASSGGFATVWQRQDKGDYEWLLTMRRAQDQSLPAPEMLPALVADCAPGATMVPWSPPLAGTDAKTGFSQDRTLQWASSVEASGELLFMALTWNGKSFDEALRIVGKPTGG